MLDVHRDLDHHRSVLTVAGPARPLEDALVRLTQAALEVIDLRRHSGVHPRLGAVDVVPFVPLTASDLPAAVGAARRYAARVAELGIPAFLYQAATEGAALSLPDVRRRAFGDLPPSAGGPAPHPTAGAVAVGARGFLVAFNVDLDTTRVRIARQIATRVRERDGGLPHVRALGFKLDSWAACQVSMNLTRPLVTGVGAAYQEVAGLARDLGVGVLRSELVGLAPRHSLPRVTDGLRLARPAKVLEDELARAFGVALDLVDPGPI